VFVGVEVAVGVAPVNGSVWVGVGVKVGVAVGEGVTQAKLTTTPLNMSFLDTPE
jgi:hypothetical protein